MKRKAGWLQEHETWARRRTQGRDELQIAWGFTFVLPRPQTNAVNVRELCLDGQPHDWSGGAEGRMPGGGYFSSVACAKCGLTAMDRDLLNAP